MGRESASRVQEEAEEWFVESEQSEEDTDND